MKRFKNATQQFDPANSNLVLLYLQYNGKTLIISIVASHELWL